MQHAHNSDKADGMKSRTNIALIVFLVIAAFFLLAEHRAHLSGWLPYWPYLLVLACPLMHLFMHGGRGAKIHASFGDLPPYRARLSPVQKITNM